MTSEEIIILPQDARSESGWLKEIAYQLALLNESKSIPAPMVPKAEELCWCGKNKGHVGRHTGIKEAS